MSAASVDAPATLSLRGITKTFATKRGPHQVLADIDLTIPEGGFATVLGPSGCGKSTLLRIVADVLPASGGEVDLFGRTAHQARGNGEFGFVFQDPVLLPWRSARTNVELALQAHGIAKKERQERAMDMLALVGLDGFEHHQPAKLSGGMARRVAIARALVGQPRVLFLDEPFNGLDEFRRRQLNAELQRIWQATGTTAILVTHDVSEAVFLSDVVFVMGRNPGRIIATRPIDLPRPRTMERMLDPEFVAHQRELTELLSTAYGSEDQE
ncbi:MAG: ABC transporter ATP-binding protein [Nocardioides sp.]|uniref:ABC transporter ATP-binding protein n=1 Tax=Nocardioides sp. TaxID=35761 RepID=UPI0039E42AE2